VAKSGTERSASSVILEVASDTGNAPHGRKRGRD
jgi:hypothetical protein